MHEHITNLEILAARADKLAAQLDKQGERNLAAAQRALAERYRTAMAEEIHVLKEDDNAAA